MTSVAIIPLRKGSKGLPGKNIRPLAGRPLFLHAVACAADAGLDRTIVTSDFDALPADPDLPHEVFARAPHTATDTAPTYLALVDVIEGMDLRDVTIVLLQATSPLRSAATVTRALDLFAGGDYDMVCSAQQADNSALKAGTLQNGAFVPVIDTKTLFTPRQELPNLYKLDGAVFVFNSDWCLANGSLETDRIGIAISPPDEALDIDTPADFDAAEAHLKRDIP